MTAAYMDGDAFYDEEFFYDGEVVTRKATMARIAMKLKNITPAQLAVKTQASLTAIAGAPTIFTDATALLTEGNALVSALSGKDISVQELMQQLTEMRTQRDLANGAVAVFYQNALAPYVTGVAEGRAEIIQAAAMDVARSPISSPLMTRVQNVRLTAGTDVGTASSLWDVVYYSKSYEVQTTATPDVEASWKGYKTVVPRELNLTGLPSGQRCYVRVRAINGISTGEWSQPVWCMVA